MIAQIVYLEAKPDSLQALLLELTANLQESRKESGVVQFDLLQLQENPLKFMLYEVYRESADLETHRQTAHFKRWTQLGLPLLAGERVRMLYNLL